MATPARVLLLGGHGKIALYLTPLLLARSWNVVSVVRDQAQEAEILGLKGDRKGNVSILVSSLQDVKSKADADKVIDSAKPDYVVWAAGMVLNPPPFLSLRSMLMTGSELK